MIGIRKFHLHHTEFTAGVVSWIFVRVKVVCDLSWSPYSCFKARQRSSNSSSGLAYVVCSQPHVSKAPGSRATSSIEPGMNYSVRGYNLASLKWPIKLCAFPCLFHFPPLTLCLFPTSWPQLLCLWLKNFINML